MARRARLKIGLIAFALVVALGGVGTVLAGGWSVVTLDREPADVVAGEPFTIGFMVRQHGRHPLSGLKPAIILYNENTRESVTIIAQPEGADGHYVATLTLPSEGRWSWKIDAFGPTAVLSPVQVGAAIPAAAEAKPEAQQTAAPQPSLTRGMSFWPLLLVVVALIVVGTLLLLLARARRRRLGVQL